MLDNIHEECGVFGIYGKDDTDLASVVYYGLFALQHRGESAGFQGPDGARESGGAWGAAPGPPPSSAGGSLLSSAFCSPHKT